jgi:O-antigen/teichoic acid export membrane protein
MLPILAFRVVAMTLSFGANIVTIHLLAIRGGADNYSIFAIIVSLLTAAPFADLGTAASVINATADLSANQVSATTYRKLLKRILRLDCSLACSGIALSVAAYLMGWWPHVLGHLASTKAASGTTTLVIICLSVCVPLGVGARILQGLGQSAVIPLWQIPAGPIQLLIVIAMHYAGAPAAAYALAIAVALLFSAVGIAATSARRIQPVLQRAADTADSRASSSDRVLMTAAPYFLTLLATTIAYQLDRIVLGHVSTARNVAAYSLVGQFVVPGISLVVMASQNLWPMFRTLVTHNEFSQRILLGQICRFLALGGVIATGAGLVVAELGASIAANRFEASTATITAGCIYLTIASAQQPISMLLNDRAGLWHQAACASAAAAVSFGLTIAWGRKYGAAGAFAASCVGAGACQFVPLWIRSLRISSAARVPV